MKSSLVLRIGDLLGHVWDAGDRQDWFQCTVRGLSAGCEASVLGAFLRHAVEASLTAKKQGNRVCMDEKDAVLVGADETLTARAT